MLPPMTPMPLSSSDSTIRPRLVLNSGYTHLESVRTMTAPAIDTLKLAERLHGAGFTRKQASGATEALADTLTDALAEHPSKGAVIESVETLGRAVDRRFTALETKVEAMDQRQQADTARIMGLLEKLLEGQAVLHQNDMELKRRLDERS